MSSSPAAGTSRLPLLLIVGTPVIIILAASWLWYFVAQGQLDLVAALGTSNNGTLITPPRQIKDAAFADDGWRRFSLARPGSSMDHGGREPGIDLRCFLLRPTLSNASASYRPG